MDGYQLTFTYDEKEMSEDFYSVFGLAIDKRKQRKT